MVRLEGWTLERYLDEAPEQVIWEFARGEVVMHSPATGEHQEVVGFLYRVLAGYCEQRGWGKVLTRPAAVQLQEDVVREPDIFVLSPQDAPKATGVPLHVRPVLVVEVMSPSTRTLDLNEKAEDYAGAGIPEYWVVDMERGQLSVHLKAGDGGRYEVARTTTGRVESRAVPGLWLQADWLFQTPLPPANRCVEEIAR